MHEALLYEQIDKQQVQCNLCAHRCKIAEGKRGVCGTRENQDGTLYSLVYGQLISENIDPIEKKPFFHFLPGSKSYSIATVGCNLRCDNCQNWQISQYPKLQSGDIIGQRTQPEQIIEAAQKNNCKSIAYTYTEPTIFIEFSLEVMKLAHQAGLKNVWVSNGYQTQETRDLLIPYLDAINIDLKFFDDKKYVDNCGAHLEPILETLKDYKKQGVWVEVTTLVVPTLSDQEETFTKIATFIKEELGIETPWHISRFSPEVSYRLQKLYPTPVEKIAEAYKIGKQIGLKYIYGGNVLDEGLENTFCPKCEETVINRVGYEIKRFDQAGACPKCKQKIELVL